MPRTAADVRREFLEFFRAKQHALVPPSPVVPYDDPTLMFTNAGMNQFKPLFLGTADRGSEFGRLKRAANSQPCIRAGGKHNDLDDVGHDTYHHTFFEMLGNWSFGDYFKKEAIEWAWELITRVWGLEPERLHATYFGGDPAEGLEPDNEARELWQRFLPPERIHPGNKKDNFWEMGDTGPCGPCSEMHIDLTPDKSGGPLVNAGDERVIEFWNLVFIQFNRGPDGKLTPLPAKHVDTGMGFERITRLIQGKRSNYDIDVFTPIFEAIQRVSGAGKYEGLMECGTGVSPVGVSTGVSPVDKGGACTPAARHADVMRDTAYRVIADHIRTLTFALADGAVPDKEGRGYVLRRILRRAVRYGWQYLNLHEPFLCKLVDTVVATMGEAFPKLKENSQRLVDIIRDEEESFERTLDRGIAEFNRSVGNAVRAAFSQSPLSKDRGGRAMLIMRQQRVGTNVPQTLWERGKGSWIEPTDRFIVVDDPMQMLEPKDSFSIDELSAGLFERLRMPAPVITGSEAFLLHDTYGFPIDLTQIMASEKGINVDVAEYEALMERARDLSRSGGRTDSEFDLNVTVELPPTDDRPKFGNTPTIARILGFVKEGSFVTNGASISPDQRIAVVLDMTGAYAEQGGQVGDQAMIRTDTGQFQVETTKRVQNCVLHIGSTKYGRIIAGQSASIEVSPLRRPTMQNHTATHVLNWALREVLGEHIQQKGSLVDPDKTRFDFSHTKAMTPDEIERVERLCLEQIRQGLDVHTNDNVPVAQKDALKINGLRAVFGEKYPDLVRVVSIGRPVADLLANPGNAEWRKYSIEFCGGTHVKNTRDIGDFVLVAEEAVAKGVRRLVGISGDAAKKARAAGDDLVRKVTELVETPPAEASRQVALFQETLTNVQIPLAQRQRVLDLLAKLQAVARKQHEEVAAASAGTLNARIDELLPAATRIGETTVFVAEVPDVGLEQLKSGADRIKQKCTSAAIVLGTRSAPAADAPPGDAGKATLLAAMSPDLIKKGLKAGDLVKAIAPIVEGGGGGPPTMAQAGGKKPEKLPDALEAGRKWIVERLGK